MLRLADIRRRFDRAAADFERADFVHAVTRDGLLERLAPVQVDARNVLDLGAATGATGRLLQKRFRRARVVAVDISHAMLRQARMKRSWFTLPPVVQAEASRLPFADGSFDLVVANQLLPWIAEPADVFGEVARVLREGGVFAFASLGPDSLRQLREAWASVDDDAHVLSFPDMHDLGDALVRAGLRDPVLDVDRISVSYEDPKKLFADLTRAGARNPLAGRSRALTGRRRFAAMSDALWRHADGGRLRVELELVYGHCWGSGPPSVPAAYRIDADTIPRRRR